MLVRGIVLGGLSASGLSLLMVGAVAIVAPPPAPLPAEPGRSAVPAAPQAAEPGVTPATLPEAPAASGPTGPSGPETASAGPSTGVELPAGSQFGRGTGQQLATPGLPEAGPSRSVMGEPPAAPQAAPEVFAPTTEIAQQPDIATAVAPVPGPVAPETDPAAPEPVVEGAPTTFRPVGIAEGESPAAQGDEIEVVVEVPGGTLAPTEIGDIQNPPPQRPDRQVALADAPSATGIAPLAPVAAPSSDIDTADVDTGAALTDPPSQNGLASGPAAPDPAATGDAPGVDTPRLAIPEAADAPLVPTRPPDEDGAAALPAGDGGEDAPRAESGPQLAGVGQGADPVRPVDGTAAVPAADAVPAQVVEPATTVQAQSPQVAAVPAADSAASEALVPEPEQVTTIAPDVAEATPVAPVSAPIAPGDGLPARVAGADTAPPVPPISGLDRDRRAPEVAEIADAEPADPVSGVVVSPTAPERPDIQLAEANVAAQSTASVPDRLAPLVPGQPETPGAAPIAPLTATPRPASPTAEDTAAIESAAPIRPVLPQDRLEPEPQDLVGPVPAPIVPRIITPGQPRRIQLDSEGADAGSGQLASEAVNTDAAIVQDGETRAILRNAAAFEPLENRPLLGIVLVDDGTGVSADNLAAIDFPVTFALDALDPTAPDRAAAYRAAGQEVVLLADALPEGGEPQDLEIALAGAIQALPQAIAVLDTPDRRLSRNRQSLPALADTGHGLLTHPGGLGSAVIEAQRAGVPAAQLYRLLDEDDERATVITRYLDRATFEAAQTGSTIVVGRARPETITAIYSWRLGDRAENVQIAPLSTLLLAQED